VTQRGCPPRCARGQDWLLDAAVEPAAAPELLVPESEVVELVVSSEEVEDVSSLAAVSVDAVVSSLAAEVVADVSSAVEETTAAVVFVLSGVALTSKATTPHTATKAVTAATAVRRRIPRMRAERACALVERAGMGWSGSVVLMG
jgi:hypothetical protein